ncbi:hypothetical protein B484DRAFT_141162 [Ochromonadaceae sp. CCMP2298]|nr:hypothetical protein B484DRAFT_141162 [Ochromonadaceae sp. CCMP2298]
MGLGGGGMGGGEETLLSSVDPDSWVGRKVVVANGRHAGQAARVVSSGNGWVQIATSTGEVAKRAYELQVSEISGGGVSGGPGEAARKRMRAGGAGLGFGDYLEQGMGEGEGGYVSTLGLENGAGGRKRPRAYSDSLCLSPRSSGGPFSFEVTQDVSSVPASVLFSLHHSHTHAHAQIKDHIGARGAGGGVEGRYNYRPRQAPIKSQAIIDAKYGYTAKYVNRHLQKLGNRPNLVDWKQQIDSSMVHCVTFERASARGFDANHCDVCSHEKWNCARFCWNEHCPVSPVYYKLTGADLGRGVSAVEAREMEEAGEQLVSNANATGQVQTQVHKLAVALQGSTGDLFISPQHAAAALSAFPFQTSSSSMEVAHPTHPMATSASAPTSGPTYTTGSSFNFGPGNDTGIHLLHRGFLLNPVNDYLMLPAAVLGHRMEERHSSHSSLHTDGHILNLAPIGISQGVGVGGGGGMGGGGMDVEEVGCISTVGCRYGIRHIRTYGTRHATRVRHTKYGKYGSRNTAYGIQTVCDTRHMSDGIWHMATYSIRTVCTVRCTVPYAHRTVRASRHIRFRHTLSIL